MRKLYPHECRHTFASLLDNVNASDATKAALNGHKKYEASVEHYVEKLLSELRVAINQIP